MHVVAIRPSACLVKFTQRMQVRTFITEFAGRKGITWRRGMMKFTYAAIATVGKKFATFFGL